MQNDEVNNAWRQQAAATAAAAAPTVMPVTTAPSQLQHAPTLPQPYSMSPRGVVPQAASGGIPFPTLESSIPMQSEPVVGAAMDSVDPWSQQQSQQAFFQSAAQDVRSIQ